MTVNPVTFTRLPASFLILVAAVLTVGPVSVAAQPVAPDSSSSALADLVDQALRSNQSLRQEEEVELARARAALAQAQGQYLSTLDL